MENNYLRRCCGVTLIDHIRVETIRDRLKVEKNLLGKNRRETAILAGIHEKNGEVKIAKEVF